MVRVPNLVPRLSQLTIYHALARGGSGHLSVAGLRRQLQAQRRPPRAAARGHRRTRTRTRGEYDRSSPLPRRRMLGNAPTPAKVPVQYEYIHTSRTSHSNSSTVQPYDEKCCNYRTFPLRQKCSTGTYLFRVGLRYEYPPRTDPGSVLGGHINRLFPS